MENEEARRIAESLFSLVDDHLSKAIDREEFSKINRQLWQEAHDLGLHKEVEKLVQARSILEMQDAIENLGSK